MQKNSLSDFDFIPNETSLSGAAESAFARLSFTFTQEHLSSIVNAATTTAMSVHVCSKMPLSRQKACTRSARTRESQTYSAGRRATFQQAIYTKKSRQESKKSTTSANCVFLPPFQILFTKSTTPKIISLPKSQFLTQKLHLHLHQVL